MTKGKLIEYLENVPDDAVVFVYNNRDDEYQDLAFIDGRADETGKTVSIYLEYE